MAIQTNKDSNKAKVVEADVIDVSTDDNTKISLAKVEEIHNDSYMLSIRDKVKNELLETGKMDQLTSQISLDDTTSIIEFGKEPANYVAGISDRILSQYSTNNINGTAKLVDALMSLMKKIDIDEIKSIEEIKEERKKKGFFSRFKESASEKLNKLVAKYKGIGSEMETICSQLKVYEEEIKRSNNTIVQMYEASMEEYRSLQEYIAAGEQALQEIKDYKASLEAQADPNDQEAVFNIRDIDNKQQLMEKRLLDLRGSEAIALQAIPTFKVQEYTNANLARKVNSAFIETIPAFKTALVTCVVAKQQALEAQGLAVLDDATSAFLEKAAQNTVTTLKMSQELTNKSAISADTIEHTWEILLNGIKDYKAMEVQYQKAREDEIKRIDAANERYLTEFKNGNTL
jgi:uncharacterized protein YaaN involved in tellurite resistance